MWLDISIAISCAVAGLAGGWVMRSIGFYDDADPNMLVTLRDSNRLTNERLEEVAQGRISEVAGRLHDYATTMAKDVDAHQTRVQAVNNTLQEQDEDGATDAVYQAVDELIAANDSMQEKLRIAQERLQDQAAQLESAEQKANTDGLTRIANRRAFDDHLDGQFDKGHQEAGTLAILDVDHFKQFNDTYGHRAGDEVLRVVASILSARLNPYGIAARFGGEEFAIIMDGMPIQTAAEIIDHARIAIGQRDIHFGDKRLRVTMSAGIAELLPSESKDDWLQRADDALYRSKDAGRDCAHWMDDTTPIRVTHGDEQNERDKETVGENSKDTAAATDGSIDSKASKGQGAEVKPGEPKADDRQTDEQKVQQSTSDSTNSRKSKSGPGDDAITELPPISHFTGDESARVGLPNPTLAEARNLSSETDDPTLGGGSEDHPLSSDGSGGESEDDVQNLVRNAAAPQDSAALPPAEAPSAPEEASREAIAASDGSRPQAFKNLPDADALAKDMTDLHQRSQTANIPLHVMAIRMDDGVGPATIDALLQIVRGAIRSVDRVGCDDAHTLLICMPNIDADLALERGRQIFHSAESLTPEETNGESPGRVSVGLADAAHDTDFVHVISRVKATADQAKADGSNIRFAESST